MVLDKIEERVILLISVTKWFLLASVVGGFVGLSTTLFLKIIHWTQVVNAAWPYYFLMLPVALALSAWMIQTWAPDAEGHGTEKVIEAVHKQAGKIAPIVVPVKLLATVVTLFAGGSVGKEGPCAQIGAGLASAFAKGLKFDDIDRKKLVICGISAGFASVFGTPVAGAILGIEVLCVGSIMYDVLLPSFIAAATSYHLSSLCGIAYFRRPIRFVPNFNEAFFVKVALAGIFFGLCAALLIATLWMGKRLAERLSGNKIIRGVIGGVALVLLTLATSTGYLGLGLDEMETCFQGVKMISYAFLLKMVFTSLTLNFGGSGGIVAPLFFIGAGAGTLFASWFGLDTATFAAIGLVALLAGAANAPIAAIIMSIELFGAKIAPYSAVACIVSFLIAGHTSVYPSQLIMMRKSPSIDVEVGAEIGAAKVGFRHRTHTVWHLITQTTAVLRKWCRK